MALAAAAIPPATDAYAGYGLGVSKGQTSPARRCGDTSALGVCASVSHLPAKKITVPVLSSGDGALGSLTKMRADTALDDGWNTGPGRFRSHVGAVVSATAPRVPTWDEGQAPVLPPWSRLPASRSERPRTLWNTPGNAGSVIVLPGGTCWGHGGAVVAEASGNNRKERVF